MAVSQWSAQAESTRSIVRVSFGAGRYLGATVTQGQGNTFKALMPPSLDDAAKRYSTRNHGHISGVRPFHIRTTPCSREKVRPHEEAFDKV